MVVDGDLETEDVAVTGEELGLVGGVDVGGSNTVLPEKTNASAIGVGISGFLYDNLVGVTPPLSPPVTAWRAARSCRRAHQRRR